MDNVGVIAGSKDKAKECIDEAKESLEAAGLECHDVEGPATEADTLGVHFSAKDKGFRPTAKRYWTLRQALWWLLSRRRVRGEQLEVLLGHATFCALIKRSTLSVFHVIYKFIHRNYLDAQPLWKRI